MRRSISFGMLFIVSLLGLIVALLVPPPTTITETNASLIAPGMTFADVERILGRPRDETDGTINDLSGVIFPYMPWIASWRGRARIIWIGEQSNIAIDFDSESGRVITVDHSPTELNVLSVESFLWLRAKRRCGFWCARLSAI